MHGHVRRGGPETRVPRTAVVAHQTVSRRARIPRVRGGWGEGRTVAVAYYGGGGGGTGARDTMRDENVRACDDDPWSAARRSDYIVSGVRARACVCERASV